MHNWVWAVLFILLVVITYVLWQLFFLTVFFIAKLLKNRDWQLWAFKWLF